MIFCECNINRTINTNSHDMNIETIYQKFLDCTGVTTDSRQCPEGSMFVALKGESFNGNKFAAAALQSGCRYAIVDEAEYAPAADERFILVDDCLAALQALANHHRRALGTTILGITGTNGKTTTKELVSTVLCRKFNTLFTEGNLNNHIGVPLTLLRLRAEHELAVVEMGANHPGEIRTLVNIVEPNYGLITNVGKAHLEGFGSFEGVIRTKGELYDFLRTKADAAVFINHENAHLQGIAAGLRLIEYGTSESLFVNGEATGNSPFLSLRWREGEDGEWHNVQTHLIGEYNLANALAAVAVGRHFGVEPNDIDEALAGYTPKNNRSQLSRTDHNTLIIDAYNANPTSMMASLQNFRHTQMDHKMAILGDMRELGADSVEEHRKVVDYLRESGFEQVILVGAEFAKVESDFVKFPNVQELIAYLQTNRPEGKTILIKGSNSIKLSLLPEYL
jgi:UDP-N-acetylmuramoyl-tripeptide--D-alanyl-D-alanine ligase